MKWQGRRKSTNVNDRRGSGAKVGGAVGGFGLIAAVIIFLLTGNTGVLTDQLGANPGRNTAGNEYVETAQEKALFDYVSVALADIEDTWSLILPESQYAIEYEPAMMTIYSSFVHTGCGNADSGVGPFYCTADRTIYLDLSFYDTLVSKYGAQSGDYVMTYVIAHEAGHHVQTLLGVTRQMDELRRRVQAGRMDQIAFNEFSVRYELQADYLAGVVARYMKDLGVLERGDLEEAMSAAAAVGDDALQLRYRGYAEPDTFNHGTSAQRTRWFNKGFEAGDLSQWDTFAVSDAKL